MPLLQNRRMDNRIKKIILVFYLLFFTTSIGQVTQEEPIGTQNITVVKSYTPSLSKAFKIRSAPVANDSMIKPTPPISYSILSVPMVSTFSPNKATPLKLQKQKQASQYNTLLAAGLGNQGQLHFDFSSVIKRSRRQSLGILSYRDGYFKNVKNSLLKSSRWEDFIGLIQKYPEQQIQLLIKRDGKIISLTVMTSWKFGVGWKKIGFLGVGSLPVIWPESMLREYKYTMWPAFKGAWYKMMLFIDLNHIVFSKLFTGKISFNVLGGPVSIFVASGQALGQGLVMFLGFLAIISLSIALINLLPLPGLDGGYIVLLFIEAVTRRPISMRFQMLLLRLGMILFMVLILQVTLNDLKRIF